MTVPQRPLSREEIDAIAKRRKDKTSAITIGAGMVVVTLGASLTWSVWAAMFILGLIIIMLGVVVGL